jgi:hypothetical protein
VLELVRVITAPTTLTLRVRPRRREGHIWGYVGDATVAFVRGLKEGRRTGKSSFGGSAAHAGDGYAEFDRALKPDDDDDGVTLPFAENRQLGYGITSAAVRTLARSPKRAIRVALSRSHVLQEDRHVERAHKTDALSIRHA